MSLTDTVSARLKVTRNTKFSADRQAIRTAVASISEKGNPTDAAGVTARLVVVGMLLIRGSLRFESH
jgi:hypothetical protein